MACKYYDDLIIAKLERWLPADTTLRVLKPDQSKELFQMTADDNADKKFKLPFIAVSRNTDIELNLNIKNLKSFDGLKLPYGKYTSTNAENFEQMPDGTYQLNVIPITLQYNLDIYTKTYDECTEYVREFLFKLINNPSLKVVIPYNDVNFEHIAYIRVLSTVTDTSAISERIFSGQFTRFTIQLEIQDAFLFSIPYRKNWKLYVTDDDLLPDDEKSCFELEVSNKINEPGEIEEIPGTVFEKAQK